MARPGTFLAAGQADAALAPVERRQAAGSEPGAGGGAAVRSRQCGTHVYRHLSFGGARAGQDCRPGLADRGDPSLS